MSASYEEMESRRDAVNQALISIEGHAKHLGECRALEMELEDSRAVVKMEAVRRIMARDGLAATPAEKIVETDEEYAALRVVQRAAVIATQKAWGEYEAARLAGQFAVEEFRVAASYGVPA